MLAALLPAFLLVPTAAMAIQIKVDDGLYPQFNPKIRDYVSHCAGALKVDVSHLAGQKASISGRPYRKGPVTSAVRRRAGARVIVAIKRPHRRTVTRYNIRCLPREFLDWDFQRQHRPHQQFYIVPSGVNLTGDGYVTVFDRRGTPVWWIHTPHPLFEAKLLPDNTMTWAYAPELHLGYQRYRLDGTRQRSVQTVGGQIDNHDIQLLPNGNFLTLLYKPRDHVDLSSFGGPSDATVSDAEIQEISPAGKLVWRWNSKDHISLDETGRWWPTIFSNPMLHPQLPDGRTAYDIAHVNSVEAVGKSLIVSFRHLDAVYMIRRTTGDVQWKLGGTETPRSLTVKNDPLGDYPFGGQHYARYHSGNRVSVHDNRTGLSEPQPRAVVYRYDGRARTATLLDTQADPDAPFSFCCGSAQFFPDGGWLIDWGGQTPTRITEFDAHHRRNFRFSFTFHGEGSPITTYRVASLPDGRIRIQHLRRAMDRLAAKGLAEPAHPGP